MLVAAAVLPHPPMLVPAVGRGGGDDLAELRAECAAAVDAVLEAGAEQLFLIGADIGPHATSFAPWAPGSPGADARLDVPEPLPLALLVGAWLTAGRRRSFVAVSPDLEPAECAVIGADLAASADRLAIVAMGDGAACHDEKAPGYVDDRAPAYDDNVHQAFSTGDLDALLGLDPGTATELMVAGRAPWQVLAGAAAGSDITDRHARLSVRYGVGYHVVTWR